MSAFSVTVLGVPAPQGSKRHVGRGVMVESSAKVGPWRDAVKWEAYNARAGAPALDGPLVARFIFTVPKPKKARRFPDRRPDLDKLIRSTCDALTDAGVIADDARIVEFERARKVYPGEDPEALDVPGVRIEIRSAA